MERVVVTTLNVMPAAEMVGVVPVLSVRSAPSLAMMLFAATNASIMPTNREHGERGERSANTVNSGGYQIDTNRYMNSGAIDHLTNDLDHLHVYEQYGAKDNVHVANGAHWSFFQYVL